MLELSLSLALALSAQNVLLLVADDLGNDYVNVYGEGPREHQPPTPHLDRLARKGVRFTHAYSNPLCSPTRATLFTGRYSFRTGIGNLVQDDDPGLDLDERTLAETLAPAGIATALVGKWHLGWVDAPVADPVEHGWHWFAGNKGNIGSYTHFPWYLSTHGNLPRTIRDEYLTTYTTDLALQFLRDLPEPWFLTVCYHAPHEPWHLPPQSLHSYGHVSNAQQKFEAMVEAMDTEIGRLLNSPLLDWTDTTVIFLGDNGTETERSFYDAGQSQQGKGSLFEAGINVPLIVAGAAVPAPGVSSALINTTDVYDTVVELTGSLGNAIDSESFAPILANPSTPGTRPWVYAESFDDGKNPKDKRCLRSVDYKLIFDFEQDRFEFHLVGTEVQEGSRTLLCAGPITDFELTRCGQQLSGRDRREFLRLREKLETIQN